VTEGQSIQFNSQVPLWLDVEEFSRPQERGSCSASEASALDERRLEQYRGEFLSGYYDDWVLVERERLHQMLLQLLERMVVAAKAKAIMSAP
jgi:two-component SAPR family response regulator